MSCSNKYFFKVISQEVIQLRDVSVQLLLESSIERCRFVGLDSIVVVGSLETNEGGEAECLRVQRRPSEKGRCAREKLVHYEEETDLMCAQY